jgi:ribosomal protein L32
MPKAKRKTSAQKADERRAKDIKAIIADTVTLSTWSRSQIPPPPPPG